MTEPGDGQPIRILHLSDIHMRAKTGWDSDPVLRALTGFIAGEVEGGMVPDLVAITGDLAFSGKAEEYERGKAWLDDLWPRLGGLSRDRLLLVPGNHDVDRSKVTRFVRKTQDDLLKGTQEDIAELFADDGERDRLLRRHDAYLAFVNDWYGGHHQLPWWQRKISVGGTDVHIAGLNSAWMCCGDDDHGRLLLGRWQVNEIVGTREADAADWRVALVHHPWDFIAEFDVRECRSRVRQKSDILLRGHLHDPATERIVPPDPSRACLELAAGSAYDGSQYPNGFQWIELLPDRQVRIHYRTWLRNDWIIDRNQPGCPDGAATISCAAPKPGPTPKAKSSAPAVPPEYRDWVRRRWEKVELLGAKEGRAVTLTQVYVPAVTRPPADPEAAVKAERRQRDDPFAEPGPQLVPLLQRLDQESLYVPAPAGAGKSTFCRWVALQSIAEEALTHPVPAPEDYAEPVPTALRGRLPVLVLLRDFSLGMECGRGEREWTRANLEQALAAWVDASPRDGLTGTLLQDHLAAGSALLLLDGLDEVAVTDVTRDGVTVYPRALLLNGLIDALPVWLKAGNRVLLTSRPYGLEKDGVHRLGLPEAGLEPLPEGLQDLFVRRWFDTLHKREKIDDLIATLRGRRDELGALVDNPMLLTAICVLYDNGNRLPDDRYELYKAIVGNVLYNRYPGDAREHDPVERRLEAVALGMHLGEKQEPRQTPAAEISWEEVERHLAGFAKKNRAYDTDGVEVAVRREELLNRSGLLVPLKYDRAAFYHLSIQEFLAAQRLARICDDVEPVFRERQGVPEWRLTLWFLFVARIADRDADWGLGLLERLMHGQDRAAVKANPAPAVLLAEALDHCLHKSYQVPPELRDGFTRLTLDAIEDEVELAARQALGLTLGRLGDPRIKSLRDLEAYVEVPAGRYPYGEDKEETVEIAAPFRIGRYPVTNGQFQEFIDAGGYTEERWWSEEGLAWLDEEEVTEPALWHDRRWNAPNQPVVGVSFWEAEACAAWAGGRLPTEQEWEAAARGPKGLEYPWGDDWQDDICNTDEVGLGSTSPVGLFARARQAALGIEDLAGNVWEWCNTFYDPSAKSFPDARLLRGGSWNLTQVNARAAYRVRNYPDDRYVNVGFRVVCSSPS